MGNRYLEGKNWSALGQKPGRDGITHCWEVGLGVGFRMELKLELLRPSDHRGRGWGGGEESDGGSMISALGEGWSNAEDSVPALGARFDGRDIVSALGSPQV